MNQQQLSRRAFIGGVSGFGAIPVLSNRSVALEGYNANSVAYGGVFEVGNAISAYDAGMVELAGIISTAYEEAKQYSSERGLSPVHAFELERLSPDSPVKYKHIRPVLKVIEVLDENLGVSLPNYSLVRACSFGAKLTSIGGILHACKALGENANRIVRVAEDENAEIDDDHRVSFGISTLTLAAELAFFYVPINFTFAWRTTRYATNRGLYLLGRLRGGNQIQAVVMSVMHWMIRDVPTQLTEYLLNGENLRTIYDTLAARLAGDLVVPEIDAAYDISSFSNYVEFIRVLAESAGEHLDGITAEDLLRAANVEIAD
jgi:hypothetical protein